MKLTIWYVMNLSDEANGFIEGDIFYLLHVKLTNF